jgi:hypothetical protein
MPHFIRIIAEHRAKPDIFAKRGKYNFFSAFFINRGKVFVVFFDIKTMNRNE